MTRRVVITGLGAVSPFGVGVTVLWEKTMRNLLAAGVEQFYEIGPGRVLAGLLKRVQRQARCQNVTA